jgi:hypothetical protein
MKSKSVAYNEIRDRITPGDLIAWKYTGIHTPSDLVGWAVSKVIGSPYYHVAVVSSILDRKMMVEARPWVVRIAPISTVREFVLSPTKLVPSYENEKLLFSKINEPYSIIKAAFSAIGRPNTGNSWQCALFAKWWYSAIGYETNSIDYDKITLPHELIEELYKVNGGVSFHVFNP